MRIQMTPKTVRRLLSADGYLDLGMPERAIEELDKIVDAGPLEGPTKLMHGIALKQVGQFPEANLTDQLPGRPRSLAQLTWHLFNVVDAFLEHEQGIPLEAVAYNRLPADGSSRADILAYGADVRQRFAAWWETAKNRTDWAEPAQVYYGKVARHEFLERTTWHSGQHSRQLMWALEDKYGIKPDRPLGPDMWQGLPMPEKVWD